MVALVSPFMRHFTAALVVIAGCTSVFSQISSDSASAKWSGIESRIAECRQRIQRAFLEDDRVETQFWMDSLQKLETSTVFGLYWDERWLLYLWLEHYAPVFAEVSRYSEIEAAEAYKTRPPKDSLFEAIDQRLFEERYVLFDQLKRAWLSAEERAFGALLVSYLLRLNLTDAEQAAFDEALDNFLKKYPNSRFRAFILKRMYYSPPAADWGLGVDFQLGAYSWSKALGRSLGEAVGAEFGLFFSKRRWIGALRIGGGTMRLRREIVHKGYNWLKGDPATVLVGGMEGGYLLYRRKKMQLASLVEVGLSGISPPADEEGEFPEYYQDVFRFNGWHFGAALQADISFNRVKSMEQFSYHGLRLRVGHRWLHLDEGNPAMQGNQFFISIGYVIFGRQIFDDIYGDY
ncbi:MAG: hypothetical protein NZM43_06230 [Saprospiraceae bacterium]|nr:hypothetical protein [Saprospiraceae bacterium]MDW8483908.1 hypothetical protein [Saprospiraceae bacterium]